MSTTFPGNPAGGGLTSPAPGRHVIPATTAPTDGDAATGASVLTAIQTQADWAAYFQLGGAWRDALGGGATSFDGPSNPTAWNDLLTNVGAPVSGLDVLPTFAAASGFAVTIGAGAGHLYTSVSIHPGESTYREIYWSSQNVTLANPDGSQPRLDAVTVTPAALGTPSTIAVVTGTPAASPAPPAIPAGSAAVFYVYVPAAASDATSFRACRGLWRRVGYPWSGMSAIIAGCELSWDYTADPASAGAQLYFGAPDLTSGYSIHRLLIDGEPIEFSGFASGVATGIVSDSTANPFGSTASVSYDRPYYIYACGGRHNPLPSVGFGGSFLMPVTVVESTVPPNPRTGKPTGNLTVNGATVTPDGAVYIGIGFVVAGTTRRRGCVMDDEMTCAFNPLQQISHSFAAVSGADDIGNFSGCAPTISTKMRLNVLADAPAADATFYLKLANFPAVGNFITARIDVQSGKQVGITSLDLAYTPRTGAELWAILSSTSFSGAELFVAAMGFNHRVRRLAGF